MTEDIRDKRFDRYWCCVWFEKSVSGVFLGFYFTIHVLLHFVGLIFWTGCAAEAVDNSLMIPGMVMSFISALMTLFIVSPVGRYFTQPTYDNRKNGCIETKKPIRASQISTCILIVGCAVFTLACIGCISDYWDGSETSADSFRIIGNFSWLFLFLVVYFIFATALEYGFGGDTFLVIFLYSVVVTNTSFAMYYLPPVVLGMIHGIALFSLIFTFCMLTVKLILALKRFKHHNFPEYLQFFLRFGIMWQIYAMVMSCLTMVNWNNSPTIWNIDANYVTESTLRNWFYIIQPVPGVISLVAILILGFISFFRCCVVSSCFDLRSDIKKSIDEAKRFSADVVANEVTPIPDMPAKDVSPSEATALLNYRSIN